MTKYIVECANSYNEDFDNYTGDYIEAETADEAIELYKQWLIENGMNVEEVESMVYRVH